VIFPEQDRSSPQSWKDALARDFGYHIDTTSIPTELLDYDILLANTLSQGPFVLGYKFNFGKRNDMESECQLVPVTLTLASRAGQGLPDINFYRAENVLCNYQPLTNASHSAGFLNGTPDNDGIVRRIPLLIEFNKQLYPAFSLALLMQYENQKSLILHTDELQINRLTVSDRHIKIDSQGNFLFGPSRPFQSLRYSATDILEGKISTEHLEEKIVIIGSTAAGLTQGYPTPFSPSATLMDLQATVLRSLFSELQPVRAPYFSVCEAAVSFLLLFCLAIISAYRSTNWSIGMCLLAICASWIGAETIFQRSGFLFSPLLPTGMMLCDCILLTILKFRHLQLQAKSEADDALILLKSSESSLKSILHTIPDIVFRLDYAGNFIFVSPAICRYTKSPQSLLGRPIFDYVVQEDKAKAQHKLNERRTGGRATVDLEIRLLFTKDASQEENGPRYFSVSAEGIYRNIDQDQKEFLGTQGIVKDITDRKRLEGRLIQAQKMEVVGNLAAGIAHDLNNILSGLVSYPDLLLLEIPKDNPLYDKISVIQKSGQKAAAIVQDLLTLARRNIALSGISNMNSIITEYLDSVEFRRLQTKYPNIAIQTDLGESVMNIKGSAVHLSKVIMNLLHNALEAMPAGGKVVISTRNICLDATFEGYESIPAGEYVCTCVADNGVGIPHSEFNRIFEPFYTKKLTDKSGTGLGMTVIWATIKDHNGYLDIYSQEGQGTNLTFYLPATKEEIEASQGRIVLEDYIGSETILVVDDIAEQIDITRNILTKLGYNVLTARTGNEAISIIKKQPVDLVILDMIMPGGPDGLETYKEILQILPGQKAIITSGFSESERVREIQHLGAGIYVQKPFNMEQIGMAIRKALGSQTSSKKGNIRGAQ
jgi:two-component system, cell cycle sensor histidine kinase and response regulator CckA